MDFSKIICIEVKKYNKQQLSKIAEQLGIDPNPSDGFSLHGCKDESVVRVWAIPGDGGPLAIEYPKKVGKVALFPNPVYKDCLYIYPSYAGLSKREKDTLLKMKSHDFFKKETKAKSLKVSTTKVVLELDVILDKINQSGIHSLVGEEKDFLDNLSRS
jgi:hypothetical protein